MSSNCIKRVCPDKTGWIEDLNWLFLFNIFYRKQWKWDRPPAPGTWRRGQKGRWWWWTASSCDSQKQGFYNIIKGQFTISDPIGGYSITEKRKQSKRRLTWRGWELGAGGKRGHGCASLKYEYVFVSYLRRWGGRSTGLYRVGVGLSGRLLKTQMYPLIFQLWS